MKEYIVSEDSYAYEMRRYDELKELIRRKDCTYYRGDHEYCVNDMFAIENGFCNWAERKEE